MAKRPTRPIADPQRKNPRSCDRGFLRRAWFATLLSRVGAVDGTRPPQPACSSKLPSALSFAAITRPFVLLPWCHRSPSPRRPVPPSRQIWAPRSRLPPTWLAARTSRTLSLMRSGWTIQFGTTDDHTRFTREQSRKSSPEERLSAVELLRRMHYVGADPSSRLQRVLVMSEVPWRAVHDRRRSRTRRARETSNDE